MIRKNPFGFISISILVFTISALSFSGCRDSSSSPHTPDIPPVIPPVQNETGLLIEASKGGSLTFEAENGIKATIDIPANTLPDDTYITLALSQSDDELEIITTPENLKFYNAAMITIDFTTLIDKYKTVKFFDVNNYGALRPLKQKHADTTISGTIYMLGTLNILKPDDSLVLEIADLEKNADSSTEWQELATTFNSLLWLCSYYSNLGDVEESASCMNAAVSKCITGADSFLDSDITGTKENINSLEKLNYLLGLCENPGNIQTRISEKYAGLSG